MFHWDDQTPPILGRINSYYDMLTIHRRSTVTDTKTKRMIDPVITRYRAAKQLADRINSASSSVAKAYDRLNKLNDDFAVLVSQAETDAEREMLKSLLATEQ